MSPVTALRDVSFGYDDVPAVTGVELTVAAGDVVALIGPNGSGKSTLVRGVLGLVPRRAPARAADRVAVAEAIEAVGLTDRRRTSVSNLSGGQQRRVLIARALAGQPEVMRARGKASADVLLAVVFYGGIAAGVVLIGLSKDGSAANLNAYLFGAITTTSPQDLWAFGILAVVVLAVSVGLAPRLFALSNDEEFARASGMNVTGLNLLLAVLTAATVVISMRVVGLLLISALMIVPNAVSQQVARSFKGSLIIATVVGVVVSVTGTTASYYLETPSGGTIVLLAVAVFVVAAVGATAVRAVVPKRTPDHTPDRTPDRTAQLEG